MSNVVAYQPAIVGATLRDKFGARSDIEIGPSRWREASATGAMELYLPPFDWNFGAEQEELPSTAVIVFGGSTTPFDYAYEMLARDQSSNTSPLKIDDEARRLRSWSGPRSINSEKDRYIFARLSSIQESKILDSIVQLADAEVREEATINEVLASDSTERILRSIEPDRFLVALSERIPDSPVGHDVLQSLLKILGQYSTARTRSTRFQILTKFLPHRSPVVRYGAAVGISELRYPGSRELLTEHLRNETSRTLRQMIEGLLQQSTPG